MFYVSRACVVRITDSTLSHATAATRRGGTMGGMFSAYQWAELTLTRCHLSHGSVWSEVGGWGGFAAGGMLHMHHGVMATLRECTLTNASTSTAGGLTGGTRRRPRTPHRCNRVCVCRLTRHRLTTLAGGMIFNDRSHVHLVDTNMTDASVTSTLALAVAGGSMVSFYQSASGTIINCRLMRGAASSTASNALGGCLMLSFNSSVTVAGTLFEQCSARSVDMAGEGGGIFVGGGSSLQLSNGSAIRDCNASSAGRTLMNQLSMALYVLPTPPGRWVPASACLVNRRACARDFMYELVSPACGAAEDACARLLPSQVNGSAIGALCEPTLAFQPCDWNGMPHLVGELVHFLPHGALEVDYPYECSAGVFGSADPSSQLSALCAGHCPPGKYCPTAGTAQALDCPRWLRERRSNSGPVSPHRCSAHVPCSILRSSSGHYCPEGSSQAQMCAPGTYSSATGVAAASHCAVCPAGAACAAGATAPKTCTSGSNAAMPRQALCERCAVGNFAEASGATACEACALGHWYPSAIRIEGLATAEVCRC
jgi:hypothetical protein